MNFKKRILKVNNLKFTKNTIAKMLIKIFRAKIKMICIKGKIPCPIVLKTQKPFKMMQLMKIIDIYLKKIKNKNVFKFFNKKID